jgi:hypothetical protein
MRQTSYPQAHSRVFLRIHRRQFRGAHVLTMHFNTRFLAHLMLRVG